jgi:hypothetical protein
MAGNHRRPGYEKKEDNISDQILRLTLATELSTDSSELTPSRNMSELKAGDSVSEGVVPPVVLRCPDPQSSRYVPYTPDKDDITSCGIPINYNPSKEWADKKVVLFAVPGFCMRPTLIPT